MHVTLVNPPYPSGAPQSIFIPLGISYLAAVLENNGHSVDVIDCQVLEPTSTKLEEELIEHQPDVIGVTSSTLTYKPAIEIVKTARKTCPNGVIMLGGPHVTVLDKQTLIEQPEADIVVRGEGEETVLELVHIISKSSLKDLDQVAGITFRKNGKIVRTPNRPFIQDIDKLPYPALNHLPLSRYKVFGKTYLPIITSRGCPFQCAFCLASQMCGKRFRARNPKKVVEELEWLRDVHGANAFTFYDDTFTFDQRRACEICDEMENKHVDLPWDCRTRVDRVSKEVLAKLRAANCQLIHFGIESGSQIMLDTMRKGVTVEQNERAIAWAKEVGMSVAISVIVGYPGETKDTLKQTVDFIGKTEPDYVYVCVPIPFPGTEFYNKLEDLGWEMSKEWNRFDEQTLVFENPDLPADGIMKTRNAIYNNLFSASYILRQSLKRDFYGPVLARTALNHILWRIKLPTWVSANFRRLSLRQKNQATM